MEYKTWLDIDLRLFDGGAAAGGSGSRRLRLAKPKLTQLKLAELCGSECSRPYPWAGGVFKQQKLHPKR